MRKGLETAGILLGAAMLVLLSLFPARGWIAVAGILAAVALVCVGQRALPRHLPVIGASVILLLMSLVSLGITPVPSVTRAETWLLWGSIGAFYLVFLWARTRDRLIWAGAGLAAMGAGYALIAPFAVDWITERKTFFPTALYTVFPRLTADAVHPNVMASVLATLMFVPLAWAVWPPREWAAPRWALRIPRTRWIWLLAALLMAGVLFLTKSRGAYLAVGISAAAFALLIARRRHWLLWALLAGVLVLAVAAFWVQDAVPLGDTLAEEVLKTDTLAFRQRLWHFGAFLVGDFPFTGIGMGAFNNAALALYGHDELKQLGAHSLYFQAALDLGIPGFLAFLAAVVVVLARALRTYHVLQRRRDDMLWPLAAGCITGALTVLLHGVVDIGTWGTRGSFVPWCVLGLLAATSALDAKRQEEGRGG